jgi:hypothetical protein
MPAIPALGRLRQEDHRFKTSLAYIEKHNLKINLKKKKGRKETNLHEGHIKYYI